MARLASVDAASIVRDFGFDFGQVNVAISQSAVALKVNVNDATSGSLNIVGVPARFDGSITGISAVLSANKTAGVLTLTPTINTTAVAPPAGTEGAALLNAAMGNAVKVLNKNVSAQCENLGFSAGDLIGVKITTDANFLPAASADIWVIVYVTYYKVQQ